MNATDWDEDNVKMWEEYLASLEANHRWKQYEIHIKRACARYREQHAQQGELE